MTPEPEGAPLTRGILDPFPIDQQLPETRINQLDKLYRTVVKALDQFVNSVESKVA